jgi:hypothetical protein
MSLIAIGDPHWEQTCGVDPLLGAEDAPLLRAGSASGADGSAETRLRNPRRTGASDEPVRAPAESTGDGSTADGSTVDGSTVDGSAPDA